MAYNENLANRVRNKLSSLQNIEEKKMMGGLCFMFNDKMCLGIMKDELLCRIDPELYNAALTKKGCHVMQFTGRPMKGFVTVNESGLKSAKDFDYWIGIALEYNKKAKASKKKKKEL